ncbi:diguanylate cyclase domain-containing protein [Motilimonas pumila]|uniref:diguanylate cyclase n=1 Tax=Motilimonas pumila TaxID=2303987 RepID=A0A418YBU1_9GAMM|nr:diguanylate cyclase [Motilimonas pumila]RJG41944.1 diguanylate cyclase [Motilimonas pumila]
MEEQKSRILIVDDEKVNLAILVELLKDKYHTLVAKSGQQALKRAFTAPHPDLILLDVMMPEMDGYQVCRELKNNPATQDIPVVFITAKDTETDEEQGLKVGAIDYITKPFSCPIIRARVHNHLELKRRGDLLKMLSDKDPLTNIANRRCFDNFLRKKWSIVQRAEQSLALLMIDIDYFKDFNDFYGHLEGDQCLKQVAQLMVNIPIRDTDLVARFGGEEFAVVMPLSDEAGAEQLAQKLMTALQQANIAHRHSQVSEQLTFSIGLAVMRPTLDDTIECLIERADKALYQAKHQGRNQYVISS